MRHYERSNSKLCGRIITDEVIVNYAAVLLSGMVDDLSVFGCSSPFLGGVCLNFVVLFLFLVVKYYHIMFILVLYLPPRE